MLNQRPNLSRTVRRITSGAFLGAISVLALVLMGSVRQSAQTDDGRSSIKFSHKFHVRDAGAACADCHAKAPASKLATDNLLAGHDNCKSCHEEQINST